MGSHRRNILPAAASIIFILLIMSSFQPLVASRLLVGDCRSKNGIDLVTRTLTRGREPTSGHSRCTDGTFENSGNCPHLMEKNLAGRARPAPRAPSTSRANDIAARFGIDNISDAVADEAI
ncbi:hypothetical protein ACLOJK_032329 [Asimina triloba]